MRMVASVLMAALILITGCGRSHVTETQLKDLAETYTRALVERRLDEARELLAGEALQAAQISFPLLEALDDVQQSLLEFSAEVEPVRKDQQRAAVTVHYRVETRIPDVGAFTERTTAVYDFARLQDQWRIHRISILESAEEGAQ